MSWYRIGTVAVTNGSTAVTGTGTSWLTTVSAGEAFVGPDGKVYEVASVSSNTALVLTTAYTGSTQSGQAYAVAPTQSFARDLATQVATLVSDYSTVKATTGAARFPDGTAAEPGIKFDADSNTGIRRVSGDTMALVAGGVDQATINTSGLTVNDAKLRITDDVDSTKVVQLQVSGVSSGTTRTLTVPNASGTLALTSNKISDFAAITSSELAGKVSDETGSGALVFATSPAFSGTPTAPTAPAGTNTTQLATTAHVLAERTNTATLTNKTLSNSTLNSAVLDGVRAGTTWDIADRAPIQPSLDLDFANQRYRVFDGAVGLKEIALADILTYTGSGRTYTDALGILRTQSSNVPRLEFDPVTGAGLGLSVWGARTNLLTYSEQFDNAAWVKIAATVTADTTAAPSGPTTADKLVETTAANSQHFVYESISGITSGSTLTYSFYAKLSERAKLNVHINDNTTTVNRATADFYLSTGVTNNQQVSGTFTSVSSTIESAGNGWYRCSLTCVAVGATGVHARIYLCDATGTSLYTGDGTSGVFIWGAQLEAGSVPSPYIPTTTSAVTAPADIAQITGSNFTKWFNQSEGTFVVVCNPTTAVATAHLISANDGTANNRTTLTRGSSLSSAVLQNTAGAGLLTSPGTSGGSFPGGTQQAVAMSYSGTTRSLSLSGAAAITASGYEPPVVTRLEIGLQLTDGYLNGTIARILYFPRALPSSLQALSA